MARDNNRYRQRQPLTEEDQEILDSIGSPNVWTPEVENLWLKTLRKLSIGDIYRRFIPMKKPPSVSRRGRSCGWGNV